MDPCPFVRLTVGGLALKIPMAAKPAHSGVHPTSTPCFCNIKLKHFPHQIAPVSTTDPAHPDPPDSSLHPAAVFHLSRSDLARLARSSIFLGTGCRLRVSIYTGRRGTTCGVSAGRLLGRVVVPLDLAGAESRACIFHSGWIAIGKEGPVTAQFHLTVKAEPDPRFVFQFDGEPECSPQVLQIQGSIRQPVFTCKFSFRSTSDRSQLPRSLPAEPSWWRSWLRSFRSPRERPGKERKGWCLTVHDLSGSPVAAASMVTPFVPSPGSDRVSRSNPGSWLILRPGGGTWKPWGRLEAWRERGSSDRLGLRFEVIPESAGTGILLAESTLSFKNGGKFLIDLSEARGAARAASPMSSPRGSGNHHVRSPWSSCMYKGFVMSACVEGEGKCSRPTVEVSVQHVACTDDAAAFVALAAAVDLSMDACRPFSQRLRKELYPGPDLVG